MFNINTYLKVVKSDKIICLKLPLGLVQQGFCVRRAEVQNSTVVFQGQESQLRSVFKDKLCLKTNHSKQTYQLLSVLGYAVSVQNGDIFVEIQHEQDIAKINQFLVESNIEVYQLSTQTYHLEDLIMQITASSNALVL